MKTIKNAVFLKSESEIKDYKGFDSPEIVVLGRSNVGKSSFINMLSGNSKLAKVSATQGKTKLINFFLFNKEFVLVDLPGYGYAKVSKEEKKKWGTMIETYLSTRENLSQVILLVDSRHKPTENDIMMLGYIRACCERAVVIATKCDKLSKTELNKNLG